MAKKLKILGMITDDNAIGYYRAWQPLKMMEKLGLVELKLTPTFDWAKGDAMAKFPPLNWFATKCDNKYLCESKGCKKCFWPDVVVAERHDFIHYINLLMALKNYRVPVVVDTDDDVRAVRPFNPGYASYKPDSDNVAYNVKLMSIADAITVSTEHLKERHSQYEKPTYVVPNSIDIKTRTFKPKSRNKKIRIGWLGSSCHWENLQIIQQAVKDVVANYPQVEFVYTNLYGDIWNNPPKEIRKQIIPECKELGCHGYHGVCNKSYVSFDKYAKTINKLKLDIGLAPLQDNLFNRSKSNLRILEYWSDKIAVIASSVRPYSETIKDNVNGLLAKEKMDWYKAMEKLILDEELRNKLKENGWKSLNEHWNAEKNAHKLYEIYQDIIKNFKCE